MTTSSHNTTSSSHFVILLLAVLVSTCTTNGENIRKEKVGKGMFSFCNEGTTYCRGITTCTATQKDHADGNCPAHKKNGGCSPRNRNFMAWRARCPVTCGQCMPAKEQLFTLAEHEQAITNAVAAATAQATAQATAAATASALVHHAHTAALHHAHAAALTALKEENDEAVATAVVAATTGMVSDTVCSGDEFESRAPITRSCSRNTVCSDDEYESQAPTATMDRVCTAQPQCAEYQVLTTAGTATSPTTCTNKCQPNQYYNTVPPQACKDMTVCPTSEVESRAPTDTTDRSCGTSKRCVISNTHGLNGAFDFVVKAGDIVISTDCSTLTRSLTSSVRWPFGLTYPGAGGQLYRDVAARMAHAGVPVVIHQDLLDLLSTDKTFGDKWKDGTVAGYYKHLELNWRGVNGVGAYKFTSNGGPQADVNFVIEQ